MNRTQDRWLAFAEIQAQDQAIVRKHNKRATVESRSFIAWDGEGATKSGATQQDYILLGASTGERITAESLSTDQCFNLMFHVAEQYPNAIHIGFAFDYDVNMILKDLSAFHLKHLAEHGTVYWREYRIEHVPNKWLSVSDRQRKLSIRICDIFGFFQTSFLESIQSYIPTHPLMADLDTVIKGKQDRHGFTHERRDEIERYWWIEIRLLAALAERLRDLLYDAGFEITSFHGPGALANFVYRKHGIREHKTETPTDVRAAAQYGYAGGRFELFRMGRHVGPVYGMDINSAYPAAIARLPSLTEGYWRHVWWPDEVQEFGIYRVELRAPAPFIKKPGPVFHRDARGNVSFPWQTQGWYWSPEVFLMHNTLKSPQFRIQEGWEYVGWNTRPFEFVEEYYAERRRMKAAKIGSEKALKLVLNSLYGKMAQRVGWERAGRAPTWHQLEWAGYVTSLTRAALYRKLMQIPWQHLIAVETDGIYTTMNPRSIGIVASTDLGGWEITQYEQLLYVQSGVYFYETATGDWIGKYRGLDGGSIDSRNMETYLQTLKPNSEWQSITGPTTRFIGYKPALIRGLDVWRSWETTQREISPGEIGKRTHMPDLCEACKNGLSAYETPHDLVIRSRATLDPQSHKHDIPWESDIEPEWREYEATQKGMVSVW